MEPTAYIESMKDLNDDNFNICEMAWLNRSGNSTKGTYIEGSLKGNLWLRSIHMDHEKMLKIPNSFTDKIKNIYYNSEKNILFISCNDGQIRVWKLPTMWGTKQMEKLDAELDEQKKQSIKEMS